MRLLLLGRTVEGDDHGVYHLNHLAGEAEALFHQAKFEHRAEFTDSEGRHYVLTRESPDHYLVAHNQQHG